MPPQVRAALLAATPVFPASACCERFRRRWSCFAGIAGRESSRCISNADRFYGDRDNAVDTWAPPSAGQCQAPFSRQSGHDPASAQPHNSLNSLGQPPGHWSGRVTPRATPAPVVPSTSFTVPMNWLDSLLGALCRSPAPQPGS